jgi:energy-coupling factor transporter ATP-binding protein EcfA2
MSLLKENFRKNIAKDKTAGINEEASFDVMYSTGFLGIDYVNGTVVHVKGNGREFTYNSTGIVDGSTNTIIGRSGSGKSTLLTQIAGKIIRPFIKKGMPTGLFIDDIEGSLPYARKEFLLGLTEEEMKEYVDMRNFGITAENLYKRIKAIADDKIQNKKDYEYDTGLFDINGNRIFKLVPTVYLVDSLPMLLPESLSTEEDLAGSMAASSIAKTNTMIFKQISQLCKSANIIFFTVNHILEEIQMGFIPKAAQISGLKQGERLPGGRAAIYLANNMFRVDDTNTLKADKDYGIDGSIVSLTLVKSRTNATKKSVPLIFNKTEGRFDEVLSLFHLLKTEAVFSGAGAYQYLEAAPDAKFSQRNFKDVLQKSPDLQKAFAEACYKVLSGYLSETRAVEVDTETGNCEDNIHDMFNAFANSGIA